MRTTKARANGKIKVQILGRNVLVTFQGHSPKQKIKPLNIWFFCVCFLIFLSQSLSLAGSLGLYFSIETVESKLCIEWNQNTMRKIKMDKHFSWLAMQPRYRRWYFKRRRPRRRKQQFIYTSILFRLLFAVVSHSYPWKYRTFEIP